MASQLSCGVTSSLWGNMGSEKVVMDPGYTGIRVFLLGFQNTL